MFEELGLSPSAGMLERFKLMGERTSQAAGAIEDIKYRLREKESIEGAYYCTYPSFVDVYHVFGRMMERTGMSVFLMLCTLNFINIETDDENQKYYSELLRESIQKAVRKGDFLHPIQHPAVSRNADRDNPGKLHTRIKTNQQRIQQKTHPPQERINRLLRCFTR